MDQLKETCTILEAKNGKEALQKVDSADPDSVAVIAIDLALGAGDDISSGLALIRSLRARLPDARILGYTLLQLEEARDSVIGAGASGYVRSDDVGGVIARVFVENEFHDLEKASPGVQSVLTTINIAISIQDEEMNILWTNQRHLAATGARDVVGKQCWTCYHQCFHRSWRCHGCVGWRAMERARRSVEEYGPSPDVRETGTILLPIKREIARVEVNAAPLLNRDGTQVLGIIEATRFTTEQWRREFSAYERLQQVVASAREMAQHAADALPCVSVSVYYRPHAAEDLYLFCADLDRSTGPPLKHLPAEDLPVVAGAASAAGTSRFLHSPSPDEQPSRFFWAAQTPNSGTTILVVASYFDKKPEGLFTEDLLPYWDYVRDNFDEAYDSREEEFTAQANVAIEGLFARAAEGGPNAEPGGQDMADGDEYVLENAAECVRAVLQPFSMHIRTLAPNPNGLVKRVGFGFYWDVAVQKRMLAPGERGSACAASERKDVWVERALVDEIKANIGRPLTPEEQKQVEKMSSYVTLPLVFGQRVLGTLNVEFDDDSLFSEAKRDFLRAVCNALSSSLGRIALTRERQATTDNFRELDSVMFASEPTDDVVTHEEQILSRVTRMLSVLTYAELVLYYRYDPLEGALTLSPSSRQGPVPEGTAIPEAFPSKFGVVGRVAETATPEFIRDYRVDQNSGVRDGLFRASLTGPERAFCEWVGCEVAVPVVVDGQVEGVLLALSPLHNWLTAEDFAIVDEFAFKTALCLKAGRAMRQLSHDLGAMESLKTITRLIGGTSSDAALYRTLLLGLTSGECLKFSRAILFLGDETKAHEFAVTCAVGAVSQEIARQRWEEADQLSLEEKVRRCFEERMPREGGLEECVSGLRIDLAEEPVLAQRFEAGQLLVRRRGEPHVVNNRRLCQVLTPQGASLEYVVAPLRANKRLVGFLVADHAFPMRPDIPVEDLGLLQIMINEFMLMAETIEHRRKGAETAEQLAWGVTYTLRTRAAALEARLKILRNRVGKEHVEAISGMEAAIQFFKRAGTLASRRMRVEKVGVAHGRAVDVNAVVSEVTHVFADPRIIFTPAPKALLVARDRGVLEDIFLEILTNARDFVEVDTGGIRVSVSAEGIMARVDVVDNGPGIHPEMRSRLFEMFKCYPSTTRMGLGLSYAKALAEHCGGDIDEVSRHGAGAHFVVRLPIMHEECP